MASRLRDLYRAGLMACALMLIGCMDASAVSVWPRAESDEVQALVDEDLRLREHHDDAEARAFLQSTTDPALLARLSPADALLTHRLAADVAEALDDQVAMTAALARAAASPLSTRDDVTSLLLTQRITADISGADDTLRVLRTRWPDNAFGDLAPNQVLDLDRSLGELTDRPGAQLDFERYLTSINWHRPRDWITTDGAVLRQAVQEWELGNRSEAERLLNRLTLPVALAAVQADRRFDAVVAAHPEHFDVERAARRDAARLKTALWLECCRPRRGAPSVALPLSDALDILGDDVGAQEAAEAAMVRNPGDSGFVDAQIALARLAFQRGAIDTVERRMRAVFTGRPKPYAGLFMAEFLVATDRGDAALGVLAPITDGNLHRLEMSPRIKTLALQVCAAAQTGDPLKIVSALGYIDAHDWISVEDTVNAHLCIGDLDGAATIVKQRLEDPRRRHSMLIALQTWKQPTYQTAWQRDMEGRRRRLRARPDVAEALNRVGRVRTYALRSPQGVQ